jgi:hypothetical protein
MADEADVKGLQETIGHAADLLGVVLPAASFVEAIAGWMSSGHDAGDPIMAALRDVNASLNRLQDLTLSEWASARADNLAVLRASATTALQTANAFLQSGADASNPVGAARIVQAQSDSLKAIEAFVGDLDDGFWLRPDSIGAISQDGDPTSFQTGWMPYIDARPRVHGFNRVWDYRWALPVAVYAIAARLAVLKATGVEGPAFRKEAKRYNRLIAKVFHIMEGGIKSYDELSEEDINRIPVFGVPMAVADIFGGYYFGGLFDPFFRSFGRAPAPPPGLVVPGSDTATILRNQTTVTQFWRSEIARIIGLPGLLQLAGTLENLMQPPPAVPQGHLKILYGGNGVAADGDALPNVGVFFGVTQEGDLHWYQYFGEGEGDVSGGTGWHENSGNRIGNGWQNFLHLLGAGDGVIIGVDQNGDLRWYQYLGNGEEDVSGGAGWHENSGNQIGNGWQNFVHLFVTPATATSALVIYGVRPNGDLLWYSYAGNGEEDGFGGSGWLENSGNPIGNGWQSFIHLHGSGNVIFGILPNGDLRWHSYLGAGESDVSGSSNWHPNSGSQIGNGWQNFELYFGGFSDTNGPGHVIYLVTESRDLLWYRYEGRGDADLSGRDWNANSSNAIGNGF